MAFASIMRTPVRLSARERTPEPVSHAAARSRITIQIFCDMALALAVDRRDVASALSFDETGHLGYRKFWRSRNHHVQVSGHHMPPLNLRVFLCGKLVEHLIQMPAKPCLQHPTPAFRNENDVTRQIPACVIATFGLASGDMALRTLNTADELVAFNLAVAEATNAATCWSALMVLARAVAGCRLFTVTTVDMQAGLARRVFTSHPLAYPVTGTKPIQRDAWFAVVHEQRRMFVANTLVDIAAVFPDHALIGSLGCGSVANLPVVLMGELAATINMLDAEQHYTAGRQAAIAAHMTMPSKLALLAARQFGA